MAMWLHEKEPLKVGHGFNLSRDLASPSGQRVIWRHGLEPLKLSHHPIKFGGHNQWVSREMVVLVCHVILKDHVIKVMWLYQWESFMVSSRRAKFGSHRHCDSEYICFQWLKSQIPRALWNPQILLISKSKAYASKANSISCQKIRHWSQAHKSAKEE